MDDGELPKFVLDVLTFVTKQPVRQKFIDVQFFPDVDKLVCELREKNTEVESLRDVEASLKRYAKIVRKTPMDKGVKKVHDYIKAEKNLKMC